MDISLFYDQFFRPDIRLERGEPDVDDGLETAVLVSLFTDRREGDERGWWGDAFDDEPLGSRLWKLDREKMTPAIIGQAQTYCQEALEWLKTEGIASKILIDISIISSDKLGIAVEITRPNGETVGYKWRYLWKYQELEPVNNRR